MKIKSGDVYIDSENGRYICIDTSWDGVGRSGTFAHGYLVSEGNEYYLSVLDVEGFEPVRARDLDVTGLEQTRDSEYPCFEPMCPFMCSRCTHPGGICKTPELPEGSSGCGYAR